MCKREMHTCIYIGYCIIDDAHVSKVNIFPSLSVGIAPDRFGVYRRLKRPVI